MEIINNVTCMPDYPRVEEMLSGDVFYYEMDGDKLLCIMSDDDYFLILESGKTLEIRERENEIVFPVNVRLIVEGKK